MSKQVFVSYAQEDREMVHDIIRFSRKSDYWYDGQIKAGQRWRSEIDDVLQSCSVALFFLSHHFWESSFIQTQELPDLLLRCKQENVVPLFIKLRYFHEDILREVDPEIREYQWLNSIPLDEFNDAQLYRFKVDLTQRIAELLSSKNGDRTGRDLGSGNIHIMTSVAGGVGKTLVSLSIMSHYLNHKKKILCADMNTMNTDLYRLLISAPSNDRQLPRSSWGYQEIYDLTIVARRNDPWKLVNGRDLWHELISLLKADEFRDSDVIVDTNLHIANIMESNNNLLRKVSQSARQVYIWIIWNYASFRDDEAIKLADARLPPNFSIVHVLNPHALLSPDGLTIEEEIEALNSHNNMRGGRNVLKEQIPIYAETDPEIAQDIALLIDKIEKKHPDLDLSPCTYFPPLNDLMNREVDTHNIRYNEFMSLVGQEFTNTSATRLVKKLDNVKANFRGRKRPKNLLALTGYDRNLKGYTQREYQSVEDLYYMIRNVSRDAKRFLEELE